MFPSTALAVETTPPKHKRIQVPTDIPRRVTDSAHFLAAVSVRPRQVDRARYGLARWLAHCSMSADHRQTPRAPFSGSQTPALSMSRALRSGTRGTLPPGHLRRASFYASSWPTPSFTVSKSPQWCRARVILDNNRSVAESYESDDLLDLGVCLVP